MNPLRTSAPSPRRPVAASPLLRAAASLACLLVVGASLAPADAKEPDEGLLVTLSATAEDEGLVVRVTLTNQTRQDLAGIGISAPLPDGAEVAATWVERAGVAELEAKDAGVRGIPGRRFLAWSGLALADGQQLGPLAFLLVPSEPEQGPTVFRQASSQATVAWSEPEPGIAVSVPLQLNGLWGEGGLRRTVLPGGLTVLTRERPETPTVSLRVAVRAGSRDEDDETSGGSHWLEHAFFLGTPTRPSDQAISGAIDTVGGQSNASTGWEHTDYWHLVPAENFDLAFEVLADQILNSTFLPEAFDRERSVVFEELKRRNDTPSIRAFDEFINMVFQVSPLRRHPGGTIESVQAIPIETILAYKDQRYVTGNVVIAAVGDLRHDQAVPKIEQAFAALPRGPRHVRPRVPEPIQTQPRRLELGQGDRLAELRLGWTAPGDDHADWPAMYILQDILGATGQRLAEEIRDRRALATSVSPSYLDFSDAGALMISASTQPDRVEQVIEAILTEVERLRDGDLSDEDVRASLRAISGRRALSEEANQGQTQRAIAEAAGSLESYEEFLARLRRATATEVQQVARRYLDPVNHTLVIVRQ